MVAACSSLGYLSDFVQLLGAKLAHKKMIQIHIHARHTCPLWFFSIGCLARLHALQAVTICNHSIALSTSWLRLYRFVLSYLASGCFILLATGATYGALAANDFLGLKGKTAGYAVTGLTTSVLVPLLNVVHYQVGIR